MNQHSDFACIGNTPEQEAHSAPATRISLPEIIAEYHARRDGGEITKERANGTLEVVTRFDGVDAELAAFDKACSQMVAACTLGTNGHTGTNFWGRDGRPKPDAEQVKMGLLQSAWRQIEQMRVVGVRHRKGVM